MAQQPTWSAGFDGFGGNVSERYVSGCSAARVAEEHDPQVRQFERYIEVTSIVKSSVFNGLYDLEVLVHEIFVITHMDHKAIDTR